MADRRNTSTESMMTRKKTERHGSRQIPEHLWEWKEGNPNDRNGGEVLMDKAQDVDQEDEEASGIDCETITLLLRSFVG